MTTRLVHPWMNAHIECIQCSSEHWISEYSELHRSLKLAFDPVSFVRDPSKIITHIFDQAFDG